MKNTPKHLAFALTLFVGFLPLLISCEDYSEDIDSLRSDIELLKKDLVALQEAFQNGKIIEKVTPLKGAPEGSWVFTFTDGTSVKIEASHEAETIIPYLKVNEEDVWTVSYDNGKTYETVKDQSGNPVPAVGKDGISIRVSINENGFYVIEHYLTTTGEVTESTVTPYNNNPSNVIQSIKEDKETGIITVTMSDGQIFTFNRAGTLPTSIILLTREISLKHSETGIVEFRVNPSDATFSIDLKSNPAGIELDVISSGTNSRSYVTTPTNYKLIGITPAFGNELKPKRGQYRAFIKDSGSDKVYNDNVTLVINTTNHRGELKQISSDMFTIKAKKTIDGALPKVYLTTPNKGGIVSKEWLLNGNIRIVNEFGDEELSVPADMKGRGNSTWSLPKKPYAIRMHTRNRVLDMPEHKRWVLLANYQDRTLIRNTVALEIARRCMEWAPRGRFVELYVEDKHLGNYYLCEQIRPDKNRVNITEITSDTCDTTGGYILEFDVNNNNEINKFKSTFGLPVAIKEPDEHIIKASTSPFFQYIETYVRDVETTLNNRNFTEVYKKIDRQSFINYWIVYELTCNTEPQHPKSCYMYKDKNGPLKAGPVWDFDWGTFVPGFNGLRNNNALWYGFLFQDINFINGIKERWRTVKPEFDKIPEFIDEQADIIRKSDETNFSMWPTTSSSNPWKPNGDEYMTFDEAINRMKQAYIERLNYLDIEINNL